MILMRNVTKAFGDVLAVQEVDLEVAPSEIICVVGPSGCGKSTLLNMLAGFDTPTSGQVVAGGTPVTRPGPDRAVVFQSDALLPWLTVYENVVLGPKALGRKDYQRRAEELLEHVHLTRFRDSYPYQLSGGMRQRAAIARVLIGDLRVLLMDEPFGALDAQTRSRMQELVQAIWQQERMTIFFITHDIEEALVLGHRVLVMSAAPGRFIEDIRVDFPHPRGLSITTEPAFNRMKARILALLHPELEAATASDAGDGVEGTDAG
jgi:NitT/TauT family transport system ATP-binding protein